MIMVGYSSDNIIPKLPVKRSKGRVKYDVHGKARLDFWGRPSKKIKHCCYCNKELKGSQITSEHLIPRRVGGKLTAPCCFGCNQDKGGYLLVDWAILLNARIKKLRAKPDNLSLIKEIRNENRKLRSAIEFMSLLYPEDYDIL